MVCIDASICAGHSMLCPYEKRCWVRRLAAILVDEQVADQRDSQRERDEQDVLHQRGALLDAHVLRVGLVLIGRDNRVDVLQEIDAAALARAAMALPVMARGALVPQRCMATRAEA